MSGQFILDPIERGVTVPVPAERAFSHFVDDFAQWWPQTYSWSGDVLEDSGIEAFAGGHCYEIGPGGFRCDWGTVIVFERPLRLVFTWQINPDRTPQPDQERASVVELLFSGSDDHGGLCRVTLVHRGFERHGESAEAYRAALNGPEGWTFILASYAGYCR
jgi:uncharacterized protein YndB with AHSA1/START domain